MNVLATPFLDSSRRPHDAVCTAVILLALGACSPAAPPPAHEPSSQEDAPAAGEVPAPSASNAVDANAKVKPEWVKANARAEILGREIYEYDHASATATDVLLAKLGNQPPVAGFLAVREAALVVYFFDRAGPGAAFRVTMKGTKPGSLELMDGKKPMPEEAAGARRAFESASKTEFPRAPGPYNAVTLPGKLVGEPGWIVYFLSAPMKVDEVVAGGHVRVSIGADGTTVREVMPLSRSALRLPMPPPNSVGIVLSHVVSDTPAETHVFLSLAHRKPIFLATRTGMWKVEDGRVAYMGEVPNAPKP